ncbi:MAG TPA: YggT family protein [Candidatus Dormibacteraeota bacterium]|nr:YggT family protein [Candidatus Dormibacteraeota bacterium]
MNQNIQQVRKVTNDGVSTTTDTRVTDEDSVTQPAQIPQISTATRIIWFIGGVVLVILAFRFVFVLLGANPANSFANFIYQISHPLAAPFFGIFGYSISYGVSRVELSTLVAMVVYALIAFGVSRLLTIRHPS